MKRCFVLLALLLLVGAPTLRAEGPDDAYIRIYTTIKEADTLSDDGQTGQALAKYAEAQSALQKFQNGFPGWNADVVRFRLNYIAKKISALSGSPLPPATPAPAQPVPPPAKPAPSPAPAEKPAAPPAEVEKPAAPADLQAEVTSLQQQVRQLQADNGLLQAKLKEALAAQPASVDPHELAKAQERATALEKENALLHVTLEQEKTAAKTEAKPEAAPEAPAKASGSKKVKANAARVKELEKQVTSLQAKVDALEAKPSPLSSEEAALLKEGQANLAAIQAARRPAHVMSPAVAKLASEAQQFFASKDFDKAEAKYTELLHEDPKNPAALANMALIQLQLRRYDDAEKNAKAALELAPSDSFALAVMGQLRFQQGKFDDAQEVLSRAAQLDPQSAEIQNYLGVVLGQKGLRGPAEAALRKAIELQPNYADAHHNLAVVYASQDPPALALARWHYQKALAAGHARSSELEKLLDRTP